MSGFLKAIFGSGQSTLDAAIRLDQEAEFRNRRNRINNAEAMINGTSKHIGVLEEQQRDRAVRKERRAEVENIRLRARVQMLNEALDRAEDYARVRFLESESLRATISHLQMCWDTQEVQDAMTDIDKMGELLHAKSKEVEASPERQESATRRAALAIKRPVAGSGK